GTDLKTFDAVLRKGSSNAVLVVQPHIVGHGGEVGENQRLAAVQAAFIEPRPLVGLLGGFLVGVVWPHDRKYDWYSVKKANKGPVVLAMSVRGEGCHSITQRMIVLNGEEWGFIHRSPPKIVAARTPLHRTESEPPSSRASGSPRPRFQFV